MTTYYRTKGFVLKKKEHGEADRIFTIFSEDFGRVEIRARAVRKIISKLRGGIDGVYFSEIEFIQGKNYKTLTDAEALDKFKGIPQNPKNLAVFNKIAEVLDSFVKGEEKDEKIFKLLKETLRRLNNSEPSPEIRSLTYSYFFWNFFSELGYMPEVNKCAKCDGKLMPYNLYFSSSGGGIICKQCAVKDCKKINSDIVKILRLIFKREWQILSRLKVEAFSQNLLDQITDNYYLYMQNHA